MTNVLYKLTSSDVRN